MNERGEIRELDEKETIKPVEIELSAEEEEELHFMCKPARKTFRKSILNGKSRLQAMDSARLVDKRKGRR